MKPKKKILFVHPDLRGGGAEKVLVNLLNTLDINTYDISLLTFFDEGVNKKLLSPHIKYSFLFKKVFRGWSLIQKVFSSRWLYKKIIKNDYDLIVAYLEGVPTRVVGGCNTPHTKIISWVHVDLTNFGIQKVFRSDSEMKNIYHKFDAVVGVSKTAINSLVNIVGLPQEKAHVIYNVVDTALILDQGNKKVENITFSNDIVNICTVGRLNRQKGYPRLLNVIKKLAEENFKFHLYILGNGALEKELINLIETYNIQNYVTMLGFNENPHKYVKSCDLFVCSSFEEGFSTAVTESVILGTPVITTDCSGMDEILDNGTIGMIVENSEAGLENGLRTLLSDPALLKHYKVKTSEKSLHFQQNKNTKAAEGLFNTLLNK